MHGRGFVNYLDAPHYVETSHGIYHNLHCSKFPCTETGPCTEIHPRGPCQSLIAERDYYHIHTIIAEDYFLPNARRWLGPCRWTHMPRGLQCDVYLPDSQRELLAEGLIIDKEGRVGQLPRKVCGENGSLTAENHSQILGYAPYSPAAVLRIVEKKDYVSDDFEKNSAADVKFLIAERDYYHIHTIIAEEYFLPNARRWLGPCRWTHMPRGIQCDVYLPDSQRELLAEGLIIDKEGRVGQLPRKVCGENGSLTAENHSQILSYASNSPAAVLRIVEKKDSVRDDFEKNSAADVKFLVNGSPIFGDRKYLSAVSPVFDKMLNGGFVEAKESEIELKDIEPVIFDDFLLAVWRKPAKPNPVNVVPLLELADRFDVSILRDSCERHLMLCYEIPLIHRLILSQKYSLSNLQDFLTGNITPEFWSKLQSSKHCKIDDLNSRTLSKITTNLAQQLLSTDDEPKYKKPRRSDSETSLGQIWCGKRDEN